MTICIYYLALMLLLSKTCVRYASPENVGLERESREVSTTQAPSADQHTTQQLAFLPHYYSCKIIFLIYFETYTDNSCEPSEELC